MPKSGSFHLPPECLQLIIAHLAARKDRHTLATLLRLSKRVCLDTLPFLYSDPWSWVYSHEAFSLVSHKRSVKRGHSLMHLLLRSVPADTCSGLVKAAYAHNLLDAPFQHWAIDYLSFVRHFQSQDSSHGSLLVSASTGIPLSPQMMDYIEAHNLREKYDELADPNEREQEEEWQRLHNTSMKNADPIPVHQLERNIHNEATWSLCNPILEQLQSLVIPLLDIGRYMDSVDRLCSLTSVTFRDYRVCTMKSWDSESYDEQTDEWTNQRNERWLECLEVAVQFVQTHTTLFKGTLRSISYPQGEECHPLIYETRMLECMPVLSDPTELTEENWKQFVAVAERTNVAHIETIRLRNENFYTYSQLDDMNNAKPFLHRCQSLRVYDTIILGPDSFKWAVQRSAQGSTSLPPLEEVMLRPLKEPLGSEIDDIGCAFGATLKSFIVKGHHYADQEPSYQTITISRGWRTPVLTTLNIALAADYLSADPDFLRHCPSLYSLSLTDSLISYVGVPNKPWHPAHLPELVNLRLVGVSAFSFDPDTLHSTKKLKNLYLGSSEGFHQVYHFDLHGVNSNSLNYASPSGIWPQWTWDWHLPCLVNLHLTVELSLGFQFRMLQRTPVLQELYLSIVSSMSRRERVLTESDFLVDPSTLEETDDQDKDHHDAQEEDPIQEPSLHLQPYINICRIHRYLHQVKQEMYSTARWIDDNEPGNREARLSGAYWKIKSRQQTHQDAQFPRTLDHRDLATGKEQATKNIERERMIADIKANVDQFPAQLKPRLDAMLEQIKAIKSKQQREQATQRRLQAAHHDWLMVPSLKKLEIHGYWHISGPVLAMMLGHVFRNLKTVDEFQCEGFETEDWIRITQRMPWLESAASTRLVDLSVLKGECKLKVYKEQAISPFEMDTRARLLYDFHMNNMYVCDDTGSSQ